MKVLLNRAMASAVGCLLLIAQATHAQAVLPSVLTISDNTIQAKLELSSQIAVDLTVEFENSVGLNANSINISAELLSPTSLSILNRLPSSLVSAPGTFPVMVSIEPKADKGFAFEDVAVVELYTKALHYTVGSPLRLFRSHDDGTFEDITMLTASGSFRARGNTGSFSDFIIMVDTRAQSDVIATKYALLDNLVNSNRSSISGVLLASVDTSLTSLYSSINTADYTAALGTVDNLITLIENADGAQIDDVWRSSDDITNVKGELLTRLYTLRYSLRTL